jgi:hypothetical protein
MEKEVYINNDIKKWCKSAQTRDELTGWKWDKGRGGDRLKDGHGSNYKSKNRISIPP